MNIGIVGLGLIGGSLGKALIRKTQHRVYGYDILDDVVVKAELIGAINAPLNREDYPNLDVLIVALMPSQVEKTVSDAAPLLKAGCLVIDICGNKAQTVECFQRLSARFTDLEFISTHPMAGKEFSGIAYSSAFLFEKASMLLVPVKAEIATVAMLKRLCFDIGFEFVKITDAAEHDKIIAYTSQLAHIISSAYINNPLAELHDGFSAGSFKDLSRVSKMNPSMWTELALGNKDNILSALDCFIQNIQEIRGSLESENAQLLSEIFTQGNLRKETVDKSSREWRRENK